MLLFDFMIPPLIVLIILLVSVSVVTFLVRPLVFAAVETTPALPEKSFWLALTTDFWITIPGPDASRDDFRA